MNKKIFEPQGYVQARYSRQRLQRYQGNALIEALPPALSDEDLMAALTLEPDFDPVQRTWETHERMQMLLNLSNFSVPMAHQLELARAMDNAMREGYVGRRPRSCEHVAIFQRIYEQSQSGKQPPTHGDAVTAQISGALIGMSGMGKTTTVQRLLARIERVIYHPELDIYQIPHLHVEAPSDGASVKGLAASILMRIDELLPGAGYYDQYVAKGRPGADTLVWSVSRVMNMHCVGLLVCDEIQNLANAPKGSQRLMTELVSACNTLRVPILFIGTNKARRVLSTDFRQARRAAGLGLTPWERLPRTVQSAGGEWEDFVAQMWRYQWVRHPTPIDARLQDTIYDCTQGIPGLAVMLFAAAQARAMSDGSEQITPTLIESTYKQAFWPIHEMLDALRHNDPNAMSSFDDIAPLDMQAIISDAQGRYHGARIHAASVQPDSEQFVPRVAAGLVSLGVSEDHATRLAEQSKSVKSVDNVLDATAHALQQLRPARKRMATGERATQAKTSTWTAQDLAHRASDYRHAIEHSLVDGKSVFSHLCALGMAADVEQVLHLA